MRLKSLLNRPFDRVKITPLGKFFSIFTLFFGIATINSGNNLLYMILAYLLILLFASGILSTVNILFLNVEPEGQGIIYKNRTGEIHIRVIKKRIPGFFLYFCTEEGCAFVPALKNGKSLVLSLPYRNTRRGIVALDILTVYSLFPFGFAKRWRYVNLNMKVIVFPSIDASLKREYEFEKFVLGEEYASKRGFDGEFRGLRRYRMGESILHIHWKKSNKELNLKEFGSMEKDSIVFRLPSAPQESEIDTVATLIHRHIGENRNVGLFVEDRFFVPPATGISHELNLLKRLALL